MKIEVNGNKNEIEFPKLMIDKNDGMIILASGITFDNEYWGTILETGKCAGYHVGSQTTSKQPFFSSCNFVDFDGTITLSN